MGKPTSEELQTALAQAVFLRENDMDEHFLGKALLNLNYRLGLLDAVLLEAKRYMHSGQSAQHHRALLRAIEKAESAERDPGSDTDMPFSR